MLEPSEMQHGRPPPQPEKPPGCPYCGRHSTLVHHRVIYGRVKGKWPWAYLCLPCDAHVGCHPGTFTPLGTPAKAELRQLRQYLHGLIARLATPPVQKRDVYQQLAQRLAIAEIDAHVALFDEARCRMAITALGAKVPRASAEIISNTTSGGQLGLL